jgi:DNA ligase D-like protein (predicted ligase)
MAATLTTERFHAPGWTFERKLDGIRMLAFKQNDEVRLLSRNRLSLTDAYPAVANAVAGLPVNQVILDGEASWAAQGRLGDADYHVFDVLWLDNRDLTPLTLEQRRAALRTIPFRLPIALVEPLDDDRPWERACREGWEGVIAKRLDSPYEHRRSKHWLKMKCETTETLVVGGFTDPQGSRVGLGALLVGYIKNDRLEYAGKVGTGLDTRQLRVLRERLDRLIVAEPPFREKKGLPRVRTHWVRPEVTVRVAFTEWTVHGRLRHPHLVDRTLDGL